MARMIAKGTFGIFQLGTRNPKPGTADRFAHETHEKHEKLTGREGEVAREWRE